MARPDAACAPYNFVDLAESVVWAPDPVPTQDRYHSAYPRGTPRFTGHLEVEIVALSPTFVSGVLSEKDHETLRTTTDETLRRRLQTDPTPYHHGYPDQPVLPSSSLTGMLEGVVAAASGARLQSRENTPIWFRNFTGAEGRATEKVYTKLVGESGGGRSRPPGWKILAGYLENDGEDWCVRPAERMPAAYDQAWEDVFNLDWHDPKGKQFGSALRVEATSKNGNNRSDSAQLDLSLLSEKPLRYHHTRSRNGKDVYEPSSSFIEYKWGQDDRVIVLRRIGNYDDYLAEDQRAQEQEDGTQVGCLVFSGNMAEMGGETPRAFAALVHPPGRGAPISVPDILVEALRARHRDSGSPYHLMEIGRGRSVFYVAEGEGSDRRVIALGLSSMPSLLATLNGEGEVAATPHTLQPGAHRPASDPNRIDNADDTGWNVDYPEALFGFASDAGRSSGRRVDGDQRYAAYRKRVAVEDAFLVPGQGGLRLTDNVVPAGLIALKTLASPKASYERTYLRGDDYYTDPDATPRGHKRYWLQGLGDGKVPIHPSEGGSDEQWETYASAWCRHIGSTQEHRSAAEALHRLRLRSVDGRLEIAEGQSLSDADQQAIRQVSVASPLRPGLRFRTRVPFENLSARELGALLFALHPVPEGEARPVAHQLGSGRPLGMGALGLTAHLVMTPHGRERYARPLTRTASGAVSWTDGGSRPIPVTDRDRIRDALGGCDAVGLFKQHVAQTLGNPATAAAFDGLDHARALYRLMAWPGIPAHPLNLTSPPRKPDLDRSRRGNTRTMLLEVRYLRERSSPDRGTWWQPTDGNEFNMCSPLPPAYDADFSDVEERASRFLDPDALPDAVLAPAVRDWRAASARPA